MNNMINVSTFDDIFLNSNDDYEPYGYNDVDESLAKIFNCIEAYKKECTETDYRFDE